MKIAVYKLIFVVAVILFIVSVAYTVHYQFNHPTQTGMQMLLQNWWIVGLEMIYLSLIMALKNMY